MKKELQEYFESIDFLPVGEKIKNLSIAIGLARKIGKGDKADATAGLEFLRQLGRKELNEAIKSLSIKQGEEVKKLAEMQVIFKRYCSKIKEAQIKAISYPDDVKRLEVMGSVGLAVYFTSGGMENWFKKNIAAQNMRPFRADIDPEIEKNIIYFNAFGIAYLAIDCRKVKEGLINAIFIQPMVFFQAESWHKKIGKGTRQPLKKAHLLMLFMILKMAENRGFKTVAVMMPTKWTWGTEKEIYREIASITDSHKKDEFGEYLKEVYFTKK